MSKIAVLLTQGFADWEYALIGGTGGPFYGLDVRYFTPSVGEVQSQGGLSAKVTQDVDALRAWQPDAMAVIGGTIWETRDAPDMRRFLKDQHSGGAVIAGICGGTLALARAGLLDDVIHTSNDPAFLSENAVGYAGDKHYLTSPSAISENRIITAPGTAPVSFTAAIFESAGVDKAAITYFKTMMAAEHG
ncbi:glutamine amidotransferase [Rhodophyticola sp. CCM32]|nr:glutamine amidotransferase [Rhodophyticola sp. CCM32]